MGSSSGKTSALANAKALITGATSGIGLACAEVLAENGVDLVITGRREERLREVASRLTKEHGVQVSTLAFDISDRTQVEKALNEKALSGITILINNAGLALGTDKLQDAKLDDLDRVIDTNIKGLLYATRLSLPHLLKAKHPHVVNIGSVAGRLVYPGGAVYCASKFAVRAINDALRMDLMGTPARITNIAPGMVETEFSEVRFGGDKTKAGKVYEGITALSARDIAESVFWCLSRPPHVNVQELILYPTDQASVGPYVTRHQEQNK